MSDIPVKIPDELHDHYQHIHPSEDDLPRPVGPMHYKDPHLLKLKFLAEFETAIEKRLARESLDITWANLGGEISDAENLIQYITELVESLGKPDWGDLQGDIYDLLDLINLLNNLSNKILKVANITALNDIEAEEGTIAYVLSIKSILVFDGTKWSALGGSSGTVSVDLESINEQIQNLKDKDIVLQSRINDTNTSLGTILETITLLQNKDTELETALLNFNTRFLTIESKNTELDLAITNLQNADASIEESIEDLITTDSEQLEQIDALQTLQESILSDIETLEAADAALDEKITNTNSRIDAINTTITLILSDVDELELVTLENKVKIDENANDIKALDIETKDLRSDVTNLQEGQKTLGDSITSLQTEVTKTKNDLNTLSEVATEAKSAAEIATTKANEVKGTIDNLVPLVNNNAANINANTNDLAEIKRKIEAGEIGGGGGGDVILYDYDGVPVYTSALIAERIADGTLPPDYILVPSATDLVGQTENRLILTSVDGSYLDIMFLAIRKLQSEVAKIRNSFKYGINSYNDAYTAMSSVASEDDEEPLWAIEEGDRMSAIADATLSLDKKHTLTPSYNVSTDLAGLLKITKQGAKYVDKAFKEVSDPKILLYLTTSNNNVKVKFGDLLYDFSSMSEAGTVNYLIIVDKHRKFIWASVTNESNVVLLQGYYNGSNFLSTEYCFDNEYNIDEVEFNDTIIYKFNGYSMYQDFSKEVIPAIPDDSDYKYEAAEITIRSVKTKSILTNATKGILNQLPNNELVFVEDTETLYIKNKGKLIKIGASTSGDEGDDDNNDDETMDINSLIQTLKQLGIVYSTEDESLELNDLSSINFINLDTNKVYNISVDANGKLVSLEVTTENTIEGRKADANASLREDIRGTLGLIGYSEYKINVDASAKRNDDIKIYADRLKVGAFYAPLSTDTVFGCTHAYIELENTSDRPINLKDIYLYWMNGSLSESYSSGSTTETRPSVQSLKLTGVIPAGGTYLIRGKLYAYPEDVNTFINVDTYDLEWYINQELIDLTVKPACNYGFALVYNNTSLTSTTNLVSALSKTSTLTIGSDTFSEGNKYPSYYIDSCLFGVSGYECYKNAANITWAINGVVVKSNSITKNTFELDPAKQAFLGLGPKDSSRLRNAKIDNDWLQLSLAKEYISFPNSNDIYPINLFSPMASFEGKNVCTDKSKVDLEKPNMVTCSFGINPYTTRTFNWVSAGAFDEYVFIKSGSTWKKFLSYLKITSAITESTSYPKRKEFSVDVNNTIYVIDPTLISRFPANNTLFRVHKCIINVVEEAVSEKTTYTYIVGRANADGTPNLAHCSEEYTFTLYPNGTTPRFYQTSDQQGFHWIEYQVWNAAANTIESHIESTKGTLVPVLINTGDMTQNGTRINEWLDYYNAGKNLFKKYEQVNCVGNNDLCNSDVNILGTGDDEGKSNSFYFHMFYCYEVDTTNDAAGHNITPIINGKYIPSLYHIDFGNTRLCMLNSEITTANCKNWFGLTASNGNVINAYTGWEITSTNSAYHNDFTSIYTMVYNMIVSSAFTKILVACHEMPFTVITSKSLDSVTYTNVRKYSRSLNEKAKTLIGCHMNQIDITDSKAKYWFSRLLEYASKTNGNVKLCIGGHKHTYSLTYPVREYYYYANGTKNSKTDGIMTMTSTLENDDSTWYNSDGDDLSKFPLIQSTELATSAGNYFYPMTRVDSLENGIVYFMCQATGYKLTSNKELPSYVLKFSEIIPKTKITGSGEDASDGASNYQKIPMFALIDVTDSGFDVYLMAIKNIMTTAGKFTQIENLPTGAPTIYYYDKSKDWVRVNASAASGAADSNDPWVTTKTTIASL